jgi:hypothetical protein
MAERNFDFLETLGRKKRVVTGSFVPNGSSALDQTVVKGTGFTVLYTTTGVYTVTFTDKYGKVLYCAARLQQATRTQEVEVGSCDPSSAGTMVIHGFAKGGTSLADITAAGGTIVSFVAVMDDQVVL